MEEDSRDLCVFCCLPIPNPDDGGVDLFKTNKTNLSKSFLGFCREVFAGINVAEGGISKLEGALFQKEGGSGLMCSNCEEYVGKTMNVKGRVDEVEGRVRRLQREVLMALKDLHKVLGEYYQQLRRIEVVVRESDGEALKSNLAKLEEVEEFGELGSTMCLLRETIIQRTGSLKTHQDTLSSKLIYTDEIYFEGGSEEVVVKVEPEMEECSGGDEEAPSPSSSTSEWKHEVDSLRERRSRKKEQKSSKAARERGSLATTKVSKFKRKGTSSRKRNMNSNDGLQQIEKNRLENNVTCEYCSRVYKERRYLRFHQRKHHPEIVTRLCTKKGTKMDEELQCELCPHIKFRSVYTLEHHFRIHHESPEKSLKCNLCPAQFSCEQYLKLHADFHQGKFKRLCDLCPHPTSFNATELLSHLKSHGEDIFQCSNCSFVCALRKTYLNHLMKHSTNLKRGDQYPCDRCPQKFSDYRMLMLHRKSKHNEEIVEHVCGIDNCTRTYFTLKGLKDHRKKCHSEDGYRCKDCNQDFSSSQQLLDHKANAHDRGYPCTQCSQRFSTRAAMDSHLVKGHGAPKFKCDLCDKAYSNRSWLNSHKRVHANTGFSCEQCGKKFGNESLLRRHTVTHKSDKLFTCDQCGMNFKWKTGLQRHLSTHADKRVTFPCDQCQRSFFTREHLKVHLRIHSGEKPFVCDLCGMDFRHLATFNLHKKRVHKLDPPMKKTSL